MVVHDYPVKRMSIDDLERRAVDFRTKCGIPNGSSIDVLKLLFDEMPEFLQKFGITLVARKPTHMGEREAYAAPKAKRIFYRPSLLARLKFGDRGASLIFLHELAHVLLHRENGGAEKAWLKAENDRVSFVSEEESAEWQATMLALCIKASEKDALNLTDAAALRDKFGLDEKHALTRFEIIRRKRSRKLPEVYSKVRSELAGLPSDTISRQEMCLPSVARLCPDCGRGDLADLNGKYYCLGCNLYGAKLQDGDTLEWT